MKYSNKLVYSILLILPLAMVGCTDAWNAHYDVENTQQVADNTLWQEIVAHPDLDDFEEYLKKYGYDKLLDGQQMFTVFAPKGALDLAGMNEKNIEKEFVKNHIARFSISANSELDGKGIAMLNEKFMAFEAQGDDYVFGNAYLVEKNIITKNGILHVIESRVPFFPNIWEFLDSDSTFSIVSEYLHSFDTAVIDVEASVPGQIVDGKQEYVDSVTVNLNEMFYRIGQLDNEDSLYSMIIPTNEAWNKSYTTIAKYYTYHSKNTLADSLQRMYTKRALVNDLVFSHTVQGAVEDSLISTANNVFYLPFENLLQGFSGIDDGDICSNGNVFVVDTLRHRPWESWHQEIVVEAENVMTLDELGANTGSYNRNLSIEDTLYNRLSRHGYMEIYPLNTRSQSEATFFVRNVLSAAYNLKVVLLPQTRVTDKANGVRPNKLTLTLNYKDHRGSSQKLSMDYTSTNPYAMDTISFVFVDKNDLDGDGDKKENLDYVLFPACNYGEDVVATTLTIESDVSSTKKVTLPDGTSKKENEVYSKALLIDCIMLEPVKE